VAPPWRELVEFSRLGEPPGGLGADEGPPEPAEFRNRYNLAPTENAPVVHIKDGRRELSILR
jgi:hypothetical protein